MAKITALSANPFPKDTAKYLLARAILSGDEVLASSFPELLGLPDGSRVGPRTIQSMIAELRNLGFNIRRTQTANRVSYQLISRNDDGKPGDLIMSQTPTGRASVAPTKAAAKKAVAKKPAPQPIAGKGGADAELVVARKKAMVKKAAAKRAAGPVDVTPTSAPAKKVIRKAS